MTKRILWLLLILISTETYAQNLKQIVLDELYDGTMEEVLQKISLQKKVIFTYESERLKRIKINDRPMSQPLDEFLNYYCNSNRLKFFQSADSAIHIVDKWEKTDNKKLETKKHTGTSPTRLDFTITGKIFDKYSHETLPYVNIFLPEAAMGTNTNIDGFFTLFKVPNDTLMMEVKYIGYKPMKIFLTPQTEITNMEIILQPEDIQIQEVVITDEKQDILQTNHQVSMLKLTPLKLNTLPNLGEKDIFRSFQLMPGISAANENSAGLYVRGGTPDQSLVQYDGFTVYNVEHLFGFYSAFNSNAIKDVQLFKGGFDAKYGGRLASVVEITGKEGNRNEFNFFSDISMMSVNSLIEFPLGKKITAVFSGRRSWKSSVYQKIFDQFSSQNKSANLPEKSQYGMGGNQTNSISSYFYDVNAKLVFRPSENENIALSIYSGKDYLDNSIQPPAMGGRRGGFTNMNLESNDLTDWGNTGASFRWSKNWNKKFYSNFLLGYSNYYSNRDRTTSGSYTDTAGNIQQIKRGLLENNQLYDYTAKIDFEYKFIPNNALEFGFQSINNLINYTFSQSDTTDLINRTSNGNTYSSYIQDRIKLFKDHFELSAGVRANYFTPTGNYYLEPRMNTSINITKKLKIKGSIGKYYQFAKRVIREDIMQGSRDFWVLADNDKLPVASSFQYIAGIAYEMNNYLIDIEGYYKTLDNLSEYSVRTVPVSRTIQYEENYQTGTGVSRGIDFLIQKKYGNYTGWIAYTIGEVSNHYDYYGNYDFYASNDVRHEFKFVNTYKYKNFDFSASWIYASGKPYTAPEGGYQLTLLDKTTADYINVSAKNGLRFPDYKRLDLSATFNFGISKLPCSLSLSVFNVFNTKNIWYKEFEIVENEIIETPVYYLGTTLNLNFTIKLH